MMCVEPLPVHVAAEANRFHIGDVVQIEPSDSRPWTYDWRDVTAEVTGVVVQDRRTVNIWLRHDAGEVTDGFRPEDLRLVSRPTRPTASEAD